MDASSALRAALADGGIADAKAEQLTGLLAAVEKSTMSWVDEDGRICIQHNPGKSYHEQAPPKLFTAKMNVTTGHKYYYSNKNAVAPPASVSSPPEHHTRDRQLAAAGLIAALLLHVLYLLNLFLPSFKYSSSSLSKSFDVTRSSRCCAIFWANTDMF